MPTAAPPTSILIPRQKHMPGYINEETYEKTGRAFLRAAIDHGLQPHHRVLDVGCGAGRFAVAASQYLNRRGSYMGLDVSNRWIRICRRSIGRKVHGFHFRHLDAFNSYYNDGSRAPANEARFPVATGTVDFVFSNSLFTHLCPADATHYLSEIGRVLKRGGRTLNTMYLLNEESRALLASVDSPQGETFEFPGSALVKHPEDPAHWIGLDEASVFDAHRDSGLELDSVRYGHWCGRAETGEGFGSKDHLVAVRRRWHSPAVFVSAAARRALRRV